VARKSSRRRTGTDERQLWNLPDITGSPANGDSTGTGSNALNVDMTELRELLGQIQSATATACEVLRDLRIETRRARRTPRPADVMHQIHEAPLRRTEQDGGPPNDAIDLNEEYPQEAKDA
jgi:hypothetical protein